MALDATVLAELMISKFAEEMESQPDIPKNTTVTTTPLEDGSTEVSVTTEVGPPEVSPDDVRPLMTAIATAVVNHLKENAYVDDTDGTAGGEWRIK